MSFIHTNNTYEFSQSDLNRLNIFGQYTKYNETYALNTDSQKRE